MCWKNEDKISQIREGAMETGEGVVKQFKREK